MQRLRAFWASGWIGKVVLGVGGLLAFCCVASVVIAALLPRSTPIVAVPAAAPAAVQPTIAPAPTAAPEPTAKPTDAPTATPVATAAPTSAPVPTDAQPTAPTESAPPQFGGLGLTRDQWEAKQGAGIKDPVLGFVYKGGAYFVFYQADPSGAETVWNIEQRLDKNGIPLEDARTISTLLLPADRKLVKTYTPIEGRLVDLYISDWLKGRFPETMWTGGEPGNFIVLYRIETGRVTSIVIGIGNNP